MAGDMAASADAGLAPGNKRIVVCCDGTWNETEEASVDPRDKCEPTNVLKFIRAVTPLDGAGVAQICYYDEGVGTRWGIDRWIGGGLGTGMSTNVQEAYRFIANNYRPGDRIFLVGFSRGAYTVRSLAGFIGTAGLLAKEQLAYAADAYAYYRTPPDERAASPYKEALKRDRLTPDQVPIELIGVWDTVGALGAPTPLLGRLTRGWVGFHNTNLGDHVQHAYQALAIDERRRPFQPAPWTRKGADTKRVMQVWFPGVHSNIGSGYADTSLSSIALNWLMHRAREHGLDFLPYAMGGVLSRTVAELKGRAQTGLLMDSFTSGYHLLRLARVAPYEREIGPHQYGDIRRRDTLVVGEMIHRSALDRLGVEAPVGRPGNLRRYAPRNLQQAKNDLPVCEYDAGLSERAAATPTISARVA
jgi:uncharacterized protein (DUF2235 family)